MSTRFGRAQLRVQKGRDKKRVRQDTFIRKLIPRKLPFKHFYIRQIEWRELERNNRLVAQCLNDLGIVRTGFCCAPYKRAGIVEHFLTSLMKGMVINPLAPHLDLKLLCVEAPVKKWNCHENIGHAVFSARFLEWIQTDDLPYYRGRSGTDPSILLREIGDRIGNEVIPKLS